MTTTTAILLAALVLTAFIGLAVAGKLLKNRAKPTPNLTRKRVLSTPEQALYHRLKAVTGDEFELLAQVSFSSLLKGKGTNWHRARQKIADFVICDKAFNVFAVIELDDNSHSAEKDKIRDQLLKDTGIKTLRWNVKNLPSTEAITQELVKIGKP